MDSVGSWRETIGGHERCFQCVETRPVVERDGEVDVMCRTPGFEAEYVGHQHVACRRADQKIGAAERSRYRLNFGQDVQKYRIDGLIASYRVHVE